MNNNIYIVHGVLMTSSQRPPRIHLWLDKLQWGRPHTIGNYEVSVRWFYFSLFFEKFLKTLFAWESERERAGRGADGAGEGQVDSVLECGAWLRARSHNSEIVTRAKWNQESDA